MKIMWNRTKYAAIAMAGTAIAGVALAVTAVTPASAYRHGNVGACRHGADGPRHTGGPRHVGAVRPAFRHTCGGRRDFGPPGDELEDL
jgi:hypothetical protein